MQRPSAPFRACAAVSDELVEVAYLKFASGGRLRGSWSGGGVAGAIGQACYEACEVEVERDDVAFAEGFEAFGEASPECLRCRVGDIG
jgi:hypothetical protein